MSKQTSQKDSGQGSKTGENEAKFTTGSTMRHVLTMALTGAVGLIALFLVDFANLFYISLLGEEELAAAIGYASTIMFFAVSIGIGLSIAAGALTAKAIGKKDGNEKTVAGASIIFTLIVTSIFAAIIFPALGYLLETLGAEGRTYDIALFFMQIVTPSIPLLGLGMVTSGLLRAIGDAKRAMFVTLSSGIAAAVIDPLLIFYFDLGITGAAISVVIVRLLFVLVGLHGTWLVHDMLAMPDRKELIKWVNPFWKIAWPAILTQLATPVGNAYVTRVIAEFGDDAVAGWAIIGRLIPLAFATIFALSGAVGPILSQNYGAGKLDRVWSTMRDSLIFIIIYVALAWGLLALANPWIITLFSAAGDSADMIWWFDFAVAGTFIFTGMLFVANAAFNNLGYPLLSTLFNWGRATLGVIPFVMIGKAWGASGVLIGWGLGGVVFGALAIIVCFRVLAKLPEKAKEEGITLHIPATANSPFTSGRAAGLK